VFVPSCGIQKSVHAADILAALRPMPTKAEWEAGQLHQYGLIALGRSGNATQLEKVTSSSLLFAFLKSYTHTTQAERRAEQGRRRSAGWPKRPEVASGENSLAAASIRRFSSLQDIEKRSVRPFTD